MHLKNKKPARKSIRQMDDCGINEAFREDKTRAEML